MRFQSFLEKIHWYFTELDLTWHLENKSVRKKIFLSLNILLFFLKVKHQLRFKNINKNHIFIKHNWSNRFQFFYLFFFLSFKMVKKVHQDIKDNCIKKWWKCQTLQIPVHYLRNQIEFQPSLTCQDDLLLLVLKNTKSYVS